MPASYPTLDLLRGYQGSTPFPSKERPGKGLEELLVGKLRSFQIVLADTEADINARRELSRGVKAEIEREYLYIKTKLLELYSWELGRSRSVESRRSGLEKLLASLNEGNRREDIESWRDVQQLKKEFRNWFKQYVDLAERIRLIVDIGTQRRARPIREGG